VWVEKAMNKYVHGYSPRETQRLQEQSHILEKVLHAGTAYPAGARVLEAGCGVGAQTVLLAERSPEAEFTCVDISQESLDEAEANVRTKALSNVRFQRADIMNLPFDKESFDHVFVCFVLEHLSETAKALAGLRRLLKKGGTITAIEGDHGSAVWNPQTKESRLVWEAMIKVQQGLGHDPLIGRRLCPLLMEVGFAEPDVSPRWIYGDAMNAEFTDGVVNKIMIPMTQTARQRSVESGLVDEATWQKGIVDLEDAAMSPGGTFFYTWFKAVAVK
jgi:ubiquinone/menaquinone biosynthesis C-methylase UbiE